MSVWAPTKVISDGLVFYYDTGNDKSYAGPPTTNLVNPSWTNWTLDSSGYSTGGTRTITSNNPYECTIVDISSNTRQWIYITGISASTTYTFSVLYKKIAGTPTLRFQIQAYNNDTYVSLMSFATTVDLGITDIYGWQKAKITLTTPAGCNKILWFMQDGDDYTGYTHSFMLANVQCEQKSYATPFTPSSRSDTQGLIDLTRTTVINLSAAGYDSNADINFSGSQYIITNSPTLASSQSSPFTMLAWNKPSNLTSWQTVFGTHGSYRQIGWGGTSFYYGGNGGAGNSLIADGTGSNNNWYLLAMVYDGTTAYAYKNGVPAGSSSIGSYTGGSNDVNVIGAYTKTGGEYFQGSIPIAMVYNRALAASEILQNFNATKGRFGL